MNYRIILKSLGILLIFEAVAILFALLVCIIYEENEYKAFLFTFIITLIVGLLLYLVKVKTNNFFPRDGFAVVGIGWIVVSFFGSLPFFISGSIPMFIDSLFESVSGFSTTGASVIENIESLSKGILFWRSMTHWIGGMGVLMLALAILPSLGAKTLYVLKAESPGPDPGKLVPKIGQTAKILYGIYVLITLLEIISLVFAGLPLYDAIIHSFGTAGTGGFSSKNLSIGAYNNVAVEIIITIFMFAFGVNFALYYHAFKGNITSFFKNAEFKFYVGIIIVSIAAIMINTYNRVFESVGETLRYSAFQVSSIITTTGYSTHDFNAWPVFSRSLLVLLMFVGASSGSTGGSIKVIRILLLIKAVKREAFRIIHPRAVKTVKLGNSVVDENIVTAVLTFFVAYIIIFVLSVLIISFEGMDIVTTVTSVAATIGNIGPGLGLVGPTGNYAQFSPVSKITLSICMIVGRLEIYPILLLVFPSFWRRGNI